MMWALAKYDNGRIRERKYIEHHKYLQGRLIFNPDSIAPSVRTSRERAMKILRSLGKTTCEINNRDCSHKKLESHHIDGNPFNNKTSNLVTLCIVHHQIIERRKISIDELRNLKLVYYISSNKRRYIQGHSPDDL